MVLALALLLSSGCAIPRQWREARTYEGHTLAEWLKIIAVEPSAGENALRLNQVPTGSEPQVVTLEVPIAYDAIARHESLTCVPLINLFLDDKAISPLIVDPARRERPPNGRCRFVWNTTFYPPGSHRLHAELCLWRRDGYGPLEARGPEFQFVSTNLLQFDPFFSGFDREHGAVLDAKVAVANAAYWIDLKTPAGATIRTIEGATATGEIKERWDLTDERGNVMTNASFDAEFTITLPDWTVKRSRLARAVQAASLSLA